MPLTTRQSEDLKSAVASYLRELGADKAFNAFLEEQNVNNVSTHSLSSIVFKALFSHRIKNFTACWRRNGSLFLGFRKR